MAIPNGAIPANKDVILISAPMTRTLHTQLTIEIENNKKNDECVVFLTTAGGDPDGAYRVARCLKHNYKTHLRIVIPSYCKSAGTLLVIAADELAIGDFGELGPLDIQVSKLTELNEQSSCLDIQQALEVIINSAQVAFRSCLMDIKLGGRLSTRLAGEIAHQFASGLFAPLVSQVDAQRLGEMSRAQTIALYYGERLDEYSHNLIRNDPRNDALMQLISGFPCHSFVIDRKEAKSLFQRVYTPEAWEEEFFRTYYSILTHEQNDVLCFERDENEVAKEVLQQGKDKSTDPIVPNKLPPVSGDADDKASVNDKQNVGTIQA